MKILKKKKKEEKQVAEKHAQREAVWQYLGICFSLSHWVVVMRVVLVVTTGI